ncbi:MAG: methionine--tRNA ligase subunit beta [Candidatus Levybacteria bacterium RIFCSPLOWO2_01_FULL_39_10]|nr:MAG: methionine--tRNA ligase subunit beta [Candidatus Levybacteria bacterium RIFCSPLOWO2_01_FULL_39_10]
MSKVTFEQFKQVEIRMGKVLECERVDGADKLLKLQVDFGDFKRQIISGIAESFSPEDLIGRTFPFVVNLEYRKIRGEESQGMILAIDVEDKTVLLEPTSEVETGAEVV